MTGIRLAQIALAAALTLGGTARAEVQKFLNPARASSSARRSG